MYIQYKLDKVRNMRFDMRAIDRFEEATDQTFTNLDMDNLRMRQIATMIWASMAHEDSQLTPLMVMDLISEHSTLPEANQMLMKALMSAYGQEGEKEKKKGTQTGNE